MWSLGENLERVLGALVHHFEDSQDGAIWQRLVEEVAHAVDEHAARLLPVQRLVQLRRDQLDATGPAGTLGGHPRETTEGRSRLPGEVHATRLREPRRHPLGVTVTAALGNAGTTAHWVPAHIRPFDTAHRFLR